MLQLFNNSKFGHQKELSHKSPDWSLLKMINQLSTLIFALCILTALPEYPGLHLTWEIDMQRLNDQHKTTGTMSCSSVSLECQ